MKLKKLLMLGLCMATTVFLTVNSHNVWAEGKNESKASFGIEDARIFFPEAWKIKFESADCAKVMGENGEILGALLNTSPLSDQIKGRAGVVPVLIAIDNKQVVKGIRLLTNSETPGMVRRIKEKGFLSSWNGIDVGKAANMDIDAVSGASLTSNAVKAGVKLKLNEYAEKEGIELKNYVAKRTVVKEKQTMDVNSIKASIETSVYHLRSGMDVPLHKHEGFDEVFYCIKGSGFGVLEDEEVSLNVGKPFIVPAGTMHTIRTEGELLVSSFLVPVVDER